MDKKAAVAALEQYREELYALSDEIWAYSEIAFRENKSCAALSHYFESKGFEVTRGLGILPTAFKAVYGSGKPVIGILGEYDALTGIGDVPEQYRLKAQGDRYSGHGCGHNLLGVGSVAAALTVKAYLEAHPGKGTVIYFGTPAEEGGSGKTYLARDGVFDGLDAALTWHPNAVNCSVMASTLANIQMRYIFDGKAAHAAASPEAGRSALDAVELMNTGVQYLREHMPSDARVHYAITDAGGKSPNVVQAHAEVLYLIRSPKNGQAEALRRRVDKIAQGAALMTETELTVQFIKACSNCVPNTPLSRVLQKNMEEFPIPELSEEEKAYFSLINSSFEKAKKPAPQFLTGLSVQEKNALTERFGQDDLDFLLPLVEGPTEMSSTDVGDVSWVCPTAQIYTATWASRVPMHSWQAVALGLSAGAKKRALYAGQIMGAAAIDLIEDPAIVKEAWEDLRLREPDGYKCPIPKDVVPQGLA